MVIWWLQSPLPWRTRLPELVHGVGLDVQLNLTCLSTLSCSSFQQHQLSPTSGAASWLVDPVPVPGSAVGVSLKSFHMAGDQIDRMRQASKRSTTTELSGPDVLAAEMLVCMASSGRLG
jgi:hypothetical protein